MKRWRAHFGIFFIAAITLWGTGRAIGAGAADGGGVALDKPVVRGRVSIALPQGWVVGKEQGVRPLLVAQAPPENALAGGAGAGEGGRGGGNFQANLLITVDPAGEKVDAAHQQEVAAHDRTQYTDYDPVEKPTTVEKGNLKGTMFGGTFRRGNLKLRSRQYLFTVDGKLYGITFTCLASSWAMYAPLLDASVATFSVK